MYLVAVIQGARVVCDKTFPFGQWQEIGYWLDEYGYNTPTYHIEVRFYEV